MIFIIYFGLVLFCAAFMLFRNELVYRVRQTAIQVIDENDLSYKILNDPSYNEMVFQFKKWTFKQFYPELVQCQNGI